MVCSQEDSLHENYTNMEKVLLPPSRARSSWFGIGQGGYWKFNDSLNTVSCFTDYFTRGIELPWDSRYILSRKTIQLPPRSRLC